MSTIEPLRFDVLIEPTPAALVVDGTVCPHCAGTTVVVITQLIEVHEYGHVTPEFATAQLRYCKACKLCR